MTETVKSMLKGDLLNAQFRKLNSFYDIKGVEPGAFVYVKKRDKYIPCIYVGAVYASKKLKILRIQKTFDKVDVDEFYINEKDLKEKEVFVCA